MELRKRAPALLFASWMIVLIQLLTLVGVIIGTLARSCVKADHCQMGKYCRHGGENQHGIDWAAQHGDPGGIIATYGGIPSGIPGNGVAGRCEFCASSPNPLPTQMDDEGNTYNGRNYPGYVGFNLTYVRAMCASPSNGIEIRDPTMTADGNNAPMRVTGWSAFRQEEWCNACYDSVLDTVWDYTNTEIMLENVQAMLWTDWVAFALCSALVGLSIVGELKVSLVAI
eukprot:SAG22_NODE_118_length_19263_cov_16.155813_10_plen_227_part_00